MSAKWRPFCSGKMELTEQLLMTHNQLDSEMQTSVRFVSKYEYFLSKKMHFRLLQRSAILFLPWCVETLKDRHSVTLGWLSVLGHLTLRHWDLVMPNGVNNLGQLWFQVMAWPSHCLDQCWHIVNWTVGNNFHWNLNQNIKLLFNEMHLKMLSAKCWPFCLSLKV